MQRGKFGKEIGGKKGGKEGAKLYSFCFHHRSGSSSAPRGPGSWLPSPASVPLPSTPCAHCTEPFLDFGMTKTTVKSENLIKLLIFF